MNLTEWVVSHNHGGRLTVQARIPDVLSLSVAPTREPVRKVWELQLLHRLPPLQAGQVYVLRFRAYGTFSAAFHMKLTLPNPPWTWIENGPLLQVSATERLYELHYSPTEDLPRVQLQMDLAAAAGTLVFSDLRFVAAGPRPSVPKKSYIICATPRSGSSWLASLLWNTGVAGRPSESFRHHQDLGEDSVGQTLDRNMHRAAFISRVIDRGMTANGVFGTKLMLGYLDRTADFLGEPFNLKASQFDQVFERYLPGVRYLHLFRRDKVDQAVSMFIASHTDAWRSGGGNGEAAVPQYDAASILRWHELLMREDSEWVRRLSRVENFAGSVAYEDLRDDYYRTISKVFSCLDIYPSACPTPEMTSVKRQVSSLKSHYIERFKAEVI